MLRIWPFFRTVVASRAFSSGDRGELYSKCPFMTNTRVEILSLTPRATPKQIREAYHRLAKKYHPDVSADPKSKEKFEEIKMYCIQDITI